MQSVIQRGRVASCAAACLAAGLFIAASGAITGCASQRCGTTCGATESNRELVRRAFDRWRDGTGGPFELLAEDARWTIVGSSPFSRTYTSREQFMAEVIRPFNARLTDPLKPTVRELRADGDMVIVLFDGVGMGKDGIAYRNSYTWHMRLMDGRAVEVVAFFDTRLFDEFWGRVSPAG